MTYLITPAPDLEKFKQAAAEAKQHGLMKAEHYAKDVPELIAHVEALTRALNFVSQALWLTGFSPEPLDLEPVKEKLAQVGIDPDTIFTH